MEVVIVCVAATIANDAVPPFTLCAREVKAALVRNNLFCNANIFTPRRIIDNRRIQTPPTLDNATLLFSETTLERTKNVRVGSNGVSLLDQPMRVQLLPLDSGAPHVTAKRRGAWW